MSNDFFRFRSFTVLHDKCAMKVGTDGVLLGAWAEGGSRILDVGTGSGLIALFMAQRYPDASVTAIDIEAGACRQAIENVAVSPFAGRISVIHSALQDLESVKFDSIVCNPPFYADTPDSRNTQRTMARSAATLSFADLFRHSARLLADGGSFSVVIPAATRNVFDTEAAFAGLFPLRACSLRTKPGKPVSRCLLSYGTRPAGRVDESEECLNDERMNRSEWYARLTADFYL